MSKAIVLFGLPGSGKSTVARMLCRLTHSVHFDSDRFAGAFRDAGLDVDARKNLSDLARIWFPWPGLLRGDAMGQPGLFGLSDHLERLSRDGDPLEVLAATVDFEYFRGWLVEGLGYGDGSKGVMSRGVV